MQNQYSEINNFGLLQKYPPKPKVLDNETKEEPKKVQKKKVQKKKENQTS